MKYLLATTISILLCIFPPTYQKPYYYGAYDGSGSGDEAEYGSGSEEGSGDFSYSGSGDGIFDDIEISVREESETRTGPDQNGSEENVISDNKESNLIYTDDWSYGEVLDPEYWEMDKDGDSLEDWFDNGNFDYVNYIIYRNSNFDDFHFADESTNEIDSKHI